MGPFSRNRVGPLREIVHYEIKLDGYRLGAVNIGKAVTVYSRRKNVLNEKFPRIAEALTKMTPIFRKFDFVENWQDQRLSLSDSGKIE